MAFVEGEDGLAVGAEEHEVGLPVAGGLAVRGEGGAVDEGAAVGDTGGGAAALAPPPAPFELGPGQIVAPGIVLRAADLGVNEAVDGFVGDDGPPGLAGQAAGHLRGRPALLEAGEDLAAQRGIVVEPGPAPAAGAGLLVGVARLIALGARPIAFQLSSNRRWRAIQTCRDLADRGAGGVASGHVTAVFNGEMCIASFHGNTLRRCCTSFVNLGNPALARLQTNRARPSDAGVERRVREPASLVP